LIVGSQFCTRLEHGSRGIDIVNTYYQETSSENTAEEYPLVEAVTRKILVKALQTGSDLVFTAVSCKEWK
jgi:hypothetical protein